MGWGTTTGKVANDEKILVNCVKGDAIGYMG
jgi:hypothetical protein